MEQSFMFHTNDNMRLSGGLAVTTPLTEGALNRNGKRPEPSRVCSGKEAAVTGVLLFFLSHHYEVLIFTEL